jgi:hypothetical protein
MAQSEGLWGLGYGLRNRGSIPGRDKQFSSSSQCAHWRWGQLSPFLGGLRRPGRKPDHSPTSMTMLRLHGVIRLFKNRSAMGVSHKQVSIQGSFNYKRNYMFVVFLQGTQNTNEVCVWIGYAIVINMRRAEQTERLTCHLLIAVTLPYSRQLGGGGETIVVVGQWDFWCRQARTALNGAGVGRRAINAFISLDERFMNLIEQEWKRCSPMNFKSPSALAEFIDKSLFLCVYLL